MRSLQMTGAKPLPLPVSVNKLLLENMYTQLSLCVSSCYLVIAAEFDYLGQTAWPGKPKTFTICLTQKKITNAGSKS